MSRQEKRRKRKKKKKKKSPHLTVLEINSPGARSFEHSGDDKESNKEEGKSAYPSNVILFSRPVKFILEPKHLADTSKMLASIRKTLLY
jgi:hypothetical protein